MYKRILEQFSGNSKRIFGDNLVGIYLHGSAAMGCFNLERSDIDLIFVLKESPDDQKRLEFLELVLLLNENAPNKGLELSVVLEHCCNPFVYPTPYEFHYSNAYKEKAGNNPHDFIKIIRGTDRDLAAHFTVICHRGITVFGRDIAEVFEKPAEEYYYDSILYDIDSAEEDIVKYPVYVSLNLCRSLAYMTEGIVMSKKEGGLWGLKYIEERYRQLIHNAVEEYTNNIPMETDAEELKKFAVYALAEIKCRADERLQRGNAVDT